MTISDAMKVFNPGPAEDRVIIMPCPKAPTDLSALPFMKRQRIIKTLLIPDNMWYLDRARGDREAAQRAGESVLPPHQFDYNFMADGDLGNSSSYPLMQPLCLAMESTAPESKSYRLLATNCYFFARTLFNALELTYAGQWEHSRLITNTRMHLIESSIKRTVFAVRPGESYKPLQKAALYMNGMLNGTSETGELIKRTAALLNKSMENTADMGELVGYAESLPP
ncbi:uncharacterized protein EI90DRAFT_3060148 [Cantharellus anzutake]|uniref:uncharacterized protein n=1 Tax=Cantharellus anzutake TaxID=1750568 RepID=UPI0019031067|nr:uncharacterized protein EI90DRAFT_3060148 [Cantharellus anzutake]KAF8330600.1 hypothetical protein EI90DRAFT_3060148 [Cantharellus anzutake]